MIDKVCFQGIWFDIDGGFPMPIKRSSSKAALKSNIKTNMKEAKAGTSPHIKSQKQALAVAYSEQREAKKKGKV
jgi:ribosomal protein S20